MNTGNYIKLLPKFSLALLILIFALGEFGIESAKGAQGKSPLAQSDAPVTVSGGLTVAWGDGGPDSKVRRGPIYFLTEKDKSPVIVEISKELEQRFGGSRGLMKKKVIVKGNWIIPPGQAKKTPVIRAEAIELQQDLVSPVSGPQPWVSILCKFADVSNEPNSLSYFEGMYASTFPGLDHYWHEQSFNAINVNGSSAAGWFTLPQPRSYYVYDQNGDGEPDLDHGRILDDCTVVADPVVYFPNYVGINMMFNADLDCCAWGATGWILTLDGVTQPWNLTWEPPWGYQNMGIMAHEMGHGFGLPHSSGQYGQVYDNQWDVMSDIWTNCDRATDPVYGCLGQHTISAYKNQLDWIPAGLKFTAAPSPTSYTITLERLALPQTGNYRIAIIPIQNSTTHYYTVEVRHWAGYDVKLPGQGVIIHEVIDGYAYVLDADNNGNTGDDGAIWGPGETFSDIANQITVVVNSVTASGADLTISNLFSNTLFNDGFESCDLSAWSPIITDGGDLSARPAAALVGSCGMQAVIDDNVSIYVTSDHPNTETRYLASFSFDPNSIPMVSGNTHVIFGGYSSTSTMVMRVQFRRSSGNYQLQASLLNDGTTWRSSSWFTITDAYHQVKLDWKAATAAGANNGGLTFWVDGIQKADLTAVDNDTRRIDRARLGAVAGIDTGTRGTYYFDNFDSSRGGGSSTVILTVNKTGTGSGTVTSSPPGINCGPDCSESYSSGTVVTLTAAPAAGSLFTGWSGGCSGTGTCTVTMTANTSVTANFDVQISTYTLSVNKTGTGTGTVTSSPAGINCGADCSETYAANASVTLTATAASSSIFTGWSGGCSGTAITCTLTMMANTSVTANFDTSNDLIFGDSFESGNFSSWSANTHDLGDLSVSPSAALAGSQGMQAVIDDANSIFVRDDTPNAEPRYRARFYFDPNSIPMVTGDTHFIFKGFSGTTSSSTEILRVELHRSSTGYEVRGSLVNDGTTWVSTAWAPIQDGPNSIELDWQASIGVGANNGSLTLWIYDGLQLRQVATVTVDNDTRRIDFVRLGALAGVDAGTRGTYYFDAFESRRQTYIGP